MGKQEEKYNRKRLQSSYLTTIVSITLVLFMLGLLGLIILHAKKLSDYAKKTLVCTSKKRFARHAGYKKHVVNYLVFAYRYILSRLFWWSPCCSIYS